MSIGESSLGEAPLSAVVGGAKPGPAANRKDIAKPDRAAEPEPR